MPKHCSVSINHRKFTARRGDLLLDAALDNGIEIPHDCRSGRCGTCQVRILDGLAISGESAANGMVRACQARVLTDLQVLVEPVPDAVTTRGIVTGLAPLAPDVTELRIHLAKPVNYLPGQYYRIQFRGFPSRCYSPTQSMSPLNDGPDCIRLHIRRVPDGRVSSALGVSINRGHHLKLRGPYGAAYLRPRQPKRLILISSSTGFAPIWSIMKAALGENPNRPIILILGGTKVEALYMRAAVHTLRQFRNVRIIPVVAEPSGQAAKAVLKGRPTDYVPALGPDDTVYACGAPRMVEAARAKASAAGAMFYADPFFPYDDDVNVGLLSRLLDRLSEIFMPANLLGTASPMLRLERLR
jgi:NAD(P)H-flavin reductase/ferredoxin